MKRQQVMYNSDTIASFITTCNGPIAGIRVSGDGCIELLKKVFFPVYQKKDSGFKPRKVYLGDFCCAGDFIDEGTAVFFKGPASYTGEDCFELFFHGTSLIAGLIIKSLIDCGARIAEPGEFTRRAFFNSKLDLLQAEAVSEIYQTKNEKALSLVYNNLKGEFSKEITEIKSRLLDVISGIEAFLDFPEDEIEAGNPEHITAEINKIKSLITRIIIDTESQNHIRNGYRIALFGLVNSGKSSIMNRFLNEDRAIITDIPGTTRDVIDGEVSIDGILYRFYDMAGMRKTRDRIERIGIKKALKIARNSDLIMYVSDLTFEEDSFTDKLVEKLRKYRHIKIKNKIDLVEEFERQDDTLYISAKTGEGFDTLKDRIIELTAGETRMDEAVFLVNERQKSNLCRTVDSLDLCLETLESGFTLDCVTVDLYDALNYLKEIIGEISTEDILDRIFSSFCIGK